MILKCSCTHQDQDKINGKGMRVHNKTTKKKADKITYRCTVCNSERTEK